MSSSIVRNQQQIFLRLWQNLQAHARSDRNLPSRIQEMLRRREFGSRDRRLYRELLYTALRYLPWVEELAARSAAEATTAVAWLAADLPSTHSYRAALLADWPPLPPLIAARADRLGMSREVLPVWFREHCPPAFMSPELEALQSRAPLWIRLQTDEPDRVLSEFTSRSWRWRQSEVCAEAYALLDEADLASTAAYRDGRFEVQDLGSQGVLASTDIAAGSRWLDACAGAGGKTLQLARLVGPSGRVEAFDIRADALTELQHRARRGGLANIRLTENPQTELYDGVLVDAPCSGSGTWRRAPHLKWCTTPGEIATYARLQQDLLGSFSALVRPGGLLLYATCSLSHRENQDVVAAFIEQRPEFAVVPPAHPWGYRPEPWGCALLPARHDTDGFFVATLQRNR